MDGQLVSVGVSIGISQYPIDGDDSEILIQRACAAMYRAKHTDAFRVHDEHTNPLGQRIEGETLVQFASEAV